MSESNQTAKPAPTVTQLSFFQAIFVNMKELPDVDWNAVAAQAGYNSGTTTRTRFGQIRRELIKGSRTVDAKIKAPSKPRAKKTLVKSEVGRGMNLTPSKITKSLPMKGKNKSVGGRGSGGLKMEEKKMGDGSGNDEEEEAEEGDDDDEDDEMDT